MANEIHHSPYSGAQIDEAVGKILDGSLVSDAASAAAGAASSAAEDAKASAEEVKGALNAFDWIPTKKVIYEKAEVLPNTTLLFSSDYTSVTGVSGGLFVVGEIYTVTWKGTDYKCKCYDDGDGAYCLGDGRIFGYDIAGDEPFFILCYGGSGAMVYKNNSYGEHVSIRIVREENAEYNKMPEGYLPKFVESVVIQSSTAGSKKLFRLTVDDNGTLRMTEVTE